MVSTASGSPAVRYLVGAVLAAVLLGDGLMIVGYTTQIRGRALSTPTAGVPGLSPEAAVPAPLSPPLLPEGAQVPAPSARHAEPPAQRGPTTAEPPNAASKPEAPRPETAQPPSSGPRRQWPDSLPDPEAVARQERGRSPFMQRCASGEISARWCHGFPGEQR